MTTINEQKLEREEDTGAPAKPQRDPQSSRQRTPAAPEPAPRRPEVKEQDDDEDQDE
jgi:hypothetical protein